MKDFTLFELETLRNDSERRCERMERIGHPDYQFEHDLFCELSMDVSDKIKELREKYIALKDARGMKV